ncbi:hypothetical protein [Duodenibacillus massiliensis]|uniref:hypothetical protein n=1 Tax=Duodenibacillus massiliensis TaxID=1852381 RepID=UPI001161285B|nr:hypothetical protein [Duodenibacillus massiliensis]
MADLGIEMDQQFSLELIRNGLLCCDIEDAIRDATQAVTERGKAATVTIKLTVKPATKSSSDNVIITDDVSVKLPKLSSGETILFACEDGRLSADNPRQGKLSFTKVEVKEPANAAAGKFEKLK